MNLHPAGQVIKINYSLRVCLNYRAHNPSFGQESGHLKMLKRLDNIMKIHEQGV